LLLLGQGPRGTLLWLPLLLLALLPCSPVRSLVSFLLPLLVPFLLLLAPPLLMIA
jgi:hypothetical protein